MHGCFWHGHDCKRGARVPKDNRDYWVSKTGRNAERDQRSLAALKTLRWKILAIWECETRDREKLAKRIAKFLG